MRISKSWFLIDNWAIDSKIDYFFEVNKAELLQEGIFFLINLFARAVLVMKKWEIEKTKPTFIVSVLKVVY